MNVMCAHDKLMSIAELKKKFHPKNHNVHPPDQIERLARLLKYQGIRKAAVISKRSDLITAGHGRILAAELNGWKKYPVDLQDYDNDEQEYADLTADNAIGAWSDLDLSAINMDLPEMGPDFDLDMLGIKEFVLEPADKGGCDEDEIPEPGKTRTKLGDRWILGDHVLVCGDSTDPCAADLLMLGEKADMVFMDPPYGMNAVSKEGKVGGESKRAPAKTYRPVIGDEDTTVARKSYELLKALAIPKMIIWGGNYFTDFLPPSACWLVWDKERPEGLTFADGEVAWTNFDSPLKFIRHRWDGYHRASERDQKRVHPTQKPAFLAEWCFKQYGSDHDSVLDLFGGSGSTLIACEKTNRKCFMMELDPHYCSVILARWEAYTGKKAELAAP